LLEAVILASQESIDSFAIMDSGVARVSSSFAFSHSLWPPIPAGGLCGEGKDEIPHRHSAGETNERVGEAENNNKSEFGDGDGDG